MAWSAKARAASAAARRGLKKSTRPLHYQTKSWHGGLGLTRSQMAAQIRWGRTETRGRFHSSSTGQYNAVLRNNAASNHAAGYYTSLRRKSS